MGSNQTKKKPTNQKKEEEQKDNKQDIIANLQNKGNFWNIGKEMEYYFKTSRFITLISTDKITYKPGEKIYIRIIALDAFTHRPFNITENFYGEAKCEIMDPMNVNVFKSDIEISEQSTFSLSWDIPKNIKGGEFTIKFSMMEFAGFPPTLRKFTIRSYSPPRLKSELEFIQKAYGEGDEVQANLSVQRAEGGIPEGATVTAIARLDNQEIYRGNYSIDKNGKCLVSFKLPNQISVGIGSLNCSIKDGGVTESASKSLPIVLRKLDVKIYPEGGELIAGVRCGVYFEAITPNGKPGDFEGILICDKDKDQNQEKGIIIKTSHEGRGRFEFIPQFNTQYSIKINKPFGVTVPVMLPKALKTGVSLISNKTVFNYKEPITISIASPQEIKELAKKEQIVELDHKIFDGVLRVTVYDIKNKKPLAERIVFALPEDEIVFNIIPDKQTYCPGDSVNLTIESQTKSGKPVEAFCGITVTDDAIYQMTEKRERPPRLPAMHFLENEVEHLEDCQIYLSPQIQIQNQNQDQKENEKENQNQYQNLDLLLGTQGWRRFIKINANTLESEKMKRLFVVSLDDDYETDDDYDDDDYDESESDGEDEDEDEDEDEIIESRFKRREDIKFKKNDSIKAKSKPQPKKEKQINENENENENESENENEKQNENEMEIEEEKEREEMPIAKPIMQKEMQSKFSKEIMMKPAFMEDLKEIKPTRITRPYLREYAHTGKPKTSNQRQDFTSTLYYCGFSSFKVFIDGFTNEGILGYSESFVLNSQKPFYLEPRLPLEVSFGDQITVPVALVNSLSQNINLLLEANVLDKGLSLKGDSKVKEVLKPNERTKKHFQMIVNNAREDSRVKIQGVDESNQQIKDDVTRTISIKPAGFPTKLQMSGVLNPDEKKNYNFDIYKNILQGSLRTYCAIYSSPMSNLADALKSLIREPYGCFEQTSTTVYPLIMAQQYFKSHSGVDPNFIIESNKKLENGYKRLIGYECKEGGFSWFGSSPASEALTAMGILEFTDLSYVFPVDRVMLERTKSWLFSKLDTEKGIFIRNSYAPDHLSHAPDEITNAYIAWSLSESNIEIKQFKSAIDYLIKNTKEGGFANDSYFLALVSLILFNFGMKDDAFQLAKKLLDLEAQEADGVVKKSKTSITSSSGRNLWMETTSFAVLSWLNFGDSFMENIIKGIQYINSNCRGGSFGSTQATILALRAIIKYDIINATIRKEGSVELKLNGNSIDALGFNANHHEPLVFPDFANEIKIGEENNFELEMVEGSALSFALEIQYTTLEPNSDEECQIDLSTRIIKANSNDQKENKIKQGELTEIEVIVSNKKNIVAPMTIAIIGLPGGFEPRYDQLKELKKQECFLPFFELFGARELVFYWYNLKPNEKISFNIDVLAAVPGIYQGPPSRAYLYYSNDLRVWNEPLKIEILSDDN